jgi:hypothetical protein
MHQLPHDDSWIQHQSGVHPLTMGVAAMLWQGKYEFDGTTLHGKRGMR